MSENSIIEIKEREILKEKIIELLKKSEDQNKPVAIAINGEWGIGKTYLWKNGLAPLIRKELKKNPIYTSVFGKKDEQAIIEDLVAQFLSAEKQKTNPIRNIINGILSFLSVHFGVKINVNVDFLFKMLKKEHMENTIVCIDEFERLSDKIPVQDILGLISELKEHKGCCVIVICNYFKLFTDETQNEQKRKIFDAYCEKVFDRIFNFSPYTKEQIEVMGDHPIKTDFEAYPYMKDIFNIDDNTINLRTFQKLNNIYDELQLKEYPNDDFKKIYQYLLYSILYIYYFNLYDKYFIPPKDLRPITNLFSPNSTIFKEVMEQQSLTIKNGIESIKTNASYNPKELQNCLKNMTNKIIQDTKYHNDFLKKCQTSKDFEEASIEFFLENKDNLKAFPYIFGFRILNYNSNFLLRAVMENHRDECLELMEKWYKSASQYRNENQQDLGEYFWINDHTFSLPLKYTIEQLDINLPKDFLLYSYNHPL
ncbi:KAP family NTPase [Helicobacter pylori]|nr:KAP family NTPase [Helicobacter pylori]WRB45245.1 KAP family NTPase [Helicobacter pylori]WRB48066.1 KAP family NTPase [Helicobacter pylori]WRD00448.1 KAP family NTPase [Helicobacter pylori]